MLSCIGLAAFIFCFGMSQTHAQVVDSSLTTITDIISDVSDVVVPGNVTHIRFGLGPVYSPDYEGSDDYKIGVKPLISFRYRNLVHVDNNHIRINVFGHDALIPSIDFNAGPLVKIDFGRDETDNPDLTGLGDIGSSIELGVFASYTIGRTRVRIRLRKDVTGGHSGTEFGGDVRVVLYKAGSLAVIGSINSTWSDSDYMDSYFSINDIQALNSGLTVFNANSGLKDVRLALGASYLINLNWDIIANASYTRLLGDVRHSPIVKIRGSSNQFVAGVFAIYSF